MSSPAPSSLVFKISTPKPELTKDELLELTVVVSNPTSNPITLLKWNTPLDPAAWDLGIVKAIEIGDPDERVIVGRKRMYRRVMPPPRKDLVEIFAPKVEVTAELRIPGFPLESGKSYRVRVEGLMTFWPVEKDKVTMEMLEAFGPGGGVTGVFQSDEVVVGYGV